MRNLSLGYVSKWPTVKWSATSNSGRNLLFGMICVKPGCDKSCTQRTYVLQQICCVRQVSGSRTKFCAPV